jgi:PAS domain S-box-containing protein
MKINKVRRVLLICNIIFIVLGVGFFAFFTPALHYLVESDAKQELNNNITFVADAIRNNSITHNYGLTVYTIPRDGNRKIKTDMYTFYIIDEEGNLLYSSNPRFRKDINYRQYEYINNGFIYQDNSGDTIGVLRNEVHYITNRIIVMNQSYLMGYEIDRDKIWRDVLTLISFFGIGFIISAGLIIFLSWWIDRQYKEILHNQQEVVEAYKLLDDTGASVEPYLTRIKKILHSFAFTTAILFAIDKNGSTIFRNKATLEAQKEMFGKQISLPNTSDDSNWVNYKKEWDHYVKFLLTTQEEYVEWDSKTYDYKKEVIYTKNRIKKIIVNNEPILICEIQNITDIELANVEIQKYIEYLVTIFNTVDDVILVTDYIGTIQNSNKSIENIFGYKLGELIGKNIETIVRSDCTKLSDNRYLCNGIKKDGTLFKCELLQNPLMLPEDEKLQLLVVEDVTEREYLKEQLYASISLTTETLKTIAENT